MQRLKAVSSRTTIRMIELRVATVEELFDVCYDLGAEHHAEVGHAALPFEPVKAIYQALEAAKAIRIWLAVLGGDVVGYASFAVTPHPHHGGIIHAAQDLIYLEPRVRGMDGLRFLRLLDDRLIALGAKIIRHTTTNAVPFGPALHRLGYQMTESIWVKVV